jgi:hypothetical protein
MVKRESKTFRIMMERNGELLNNMTSLTKHLTSALPLSRASTLRYGIHTYLPTVHKDYSMIAAMPMDYF